MAPDEPSTSDGHHVASEATSTDRPDRTASGIYRGWTIVAALFLTTFVLFGVSIYAFIVIAQPLGDERGWSAVQTGSAISAMWLTAPLALLSGPILRRWKPWHLIYLGIFVQAVALIVLPTVSHIEWLLALRLMMGVGKILTITAVPMVVSDWFSKRFATAMSIIWAGGAAGGFAFSPLAEELIQRAGWHGASFVLGGVVIGSLMVIGFLVRGPASPAEMSLSVDGLPLPTAHHQAADSLEGPILGKTWQQQFAMLEHKTTAFAMFISVVGIGMASIAVLTQEQAVLNTVGIVGTQAATYLGLTAIGSLAGSLVIGFLLDRMRALWSSALTALALYMGVLAFACMGAFLPAILPLLAAISCGFAFGAGEVLWITLTKRQFGSALFAITYGGWYFALQLGYAAGGSLGGWGMERFGSIGFLALVGLMYLPALVLSLTIHAAHASLGGVSNEEMKAG